MSLKKLSVVAKALAAAACITLTGCAVGPTYAPPVSSNVTAWQAPLPHDGAVANLADWWARWNDPALSALIRAAQSSSPTLAQAAARISQARALQVIAGSSTLPAATASASLSTANSGNAGAGARSVSSLGGTLQAAWELDLFGANRRGREAADARLSARNLDWHQARVSIAAEVAAAYVSLRASEALATGFERDRESRTETARLTRLKVDAGFEAPANAALAKASAAEASARVSAQRAETDLSIKALVALTGLAEADLRSALLPGQAQLPQAATLAIERLPAAVLAQRPDLVSAERELAALTAEVGAAEADRYPRITLTGSIGYSVARAAGVTSDGLSWGFGPSITVPLFDSGRRLASVQLAQTRVDESLAACKAVAIRAVREVEEALTQSQAARLRAPDLQAALQGYVAFEKAAGARLAAGAGSVLELEDARRAVLAAQVAVLAVARDQLNAAIALYRAAGGGWEPSLTNFQLQVTEKK
jgi:outer membrane protein, multidrug efflux system